MSAPRGHVGCYLIRDEFGDIYCTTHGTQDDPCAPREHVEAVAGVNYDGPDELGLADAERILNSTDPAVHAAMLDALVRAGVLHLDVEGICDDEERVVIAKERRYVTEWEAL